MVVKLIYGEPRIIRYKQNIPLTFYKNSFSNIHVYSLLDTRAGWWGNEAICVSNIPLACHIAASFVIMEKGK